MNNDHPSIDRIAELQQLIADFAAIKRMVSLADKQRKENDVEHSFGLALTCWFLAPKIAPELNLEKILKYALAHDIVELHAGDTFIFDTENLQTKSEREDDAIKKIATDWQDFPGLASFAEGYKDHIDDEAKFVYAVDKLLPPLMAALDPYRNHWKIHKITKQMHDDHKRDKIRVSKEAGPYYEKLIEWVDNHIEYYDPEEHRSGKA